MATNAQTPRGRGYDQSLHYFHHANDYWTSQTDSCPSGFGKESTVEITDLWQTNIDEQGFQGPAHLYNNSCDPDSLMDYTFGTKCKIALVILSRFVALPISLIQKASLFQVSHTA